MIQIGDLLGLLLSYFGLNKTKQVAMFCTAALDSNCTLPLGMGYGVLALMHWMFWVAYQDLGNQDRGCFNKVMYFCIFPWQKETNRRHFVKLLSSLLLPQVTRSLEATYWQMYELPPVRWQPLKCSHPRSLDDYRIRLQLSQMPAMPPDYIREVFVTTEYFCT